MDPNNYGDALGGDYTPHTIDFHRPLYKGDDEVAYPTIVEYTTPNGQMGYHTEVPTTSSHPHLHPHPHSHHPQPHSQNPEQYPMTGPLILSYTPVSGVALPQLTLCQVHPSRGTPALLAQGSLHIWQSTPPTPQTPPILTIQVDTIRFYITPHDTTYKISKQEYMFLMPNDCLGLCLPMAVPYQNTDLIAAMDFVLAQFFSATQNFRLEMPTKMGTEDEGEVLSPTDYTLQQNQQAAWDMLDKKKSNQLTQDSRTAGQILKMSAWISEKIVDQAEKTSHKVEEKGHRKTMDLREAMNERQGDDEKEKQDIPKTAVKASGMARSSTRKAAKMVSKINDKVSGKASDKLEKHVEIRESDSDRKKRIRRITAASLEAYSQVSDALADGYGQVLETTQDQSKEYATLKYGPNGAQVAEDVAATAYHTGSAAYNARRVVNVRKIATGQVKNAAKAHAETAAGIKRG